jgi:dTDP-4-amino-4,6-dideoxygalactose transaminase
MSAPPAPIAMFDYRQGLARIRAEIDQAIREVLDSGTLILGPRVRQFEENFARWLGTPGQAVAVGNGTDAIACALRALGIGPGDEVLTVANTAIPTVSAIRMAGATPVLVDVDPQTCLMDPALIEPRITSRTKALLPVHLFGNAAPLAPLLEIAARHGLKVVEDCAQSCGTRYQGRAAGTFGDVGCFSFYPTKNLGAYGDGGLCFTRDPVLAEALRQVRVYGCGETYSAEREGVNSRLDELQAAILDVKLRHLPAWLAERRRIAGWYDAYLSPSIARPRPAPGAEHSYHLYVILAEDRSRLIDALKAAQIGYGIHYPAPIHLMTAYRFLGYRPGDLPQTERLAGQVLSLPCYPEISEDAVRRVAEVVNRGCC